MDTINTEMCGPFGLVWENSIFNSKYTNNTGIYFFTFNIEDKYLIEYIWITTRGFEQRFLEHIRELLSGWYRIYDFEKIKNNEDFVIWKGRYGKNIDDINVFLDNYLSYSQNIHQQLENFKIFLLPLNGEKRTIERIEGKIYQILRKGNNKQTMTFINGVRSCPKRENEESLNFKILNNMLSSSDIPDEFTI